MLLCCVLYQTDGADVTLLCTVPNRWCWCYFAVYCTKRMVLMLLCCVLYQTDGADVTLLCTVPNGWCWCYFVVYCTKRYHTAVYGLMPLLHLHFMYRNLGMWGGGKQNPSKSVGEQVDVWTANQPPSITTASKTQHVSSALQGPNIERGATQEIIQHNRM
jgi:hypothetical protein